MKLFGVTCTYPVAVAGTHGWYDRICMSERQHPLVLNVVAITKAHLVLEREGSV